MIKMADAFDVIASRQAKQVAERFGKIAQQESTLLADVIRTSKLLPTEFEELQTELPGEYQILLSDLSEESAMAKLAEDIEKQNSMTNPDLSNLDVSPSVDVQQRDEMIEAIASVKSDNRALLERNNELQEEKAHLLEQNNEYQARIDELVEKTNDLQETNNSLQETQIQLARNQRRRDRIGLGLKLIGAMSPVTGAFTVGLIPLWSGLLVTLFIIGVLCWQDEILSSYLS